MHGKLQRAARIVSATLSGVALLVLGGASTVRGDTTDYLQIGTKSTAYHTSTITAAEIVDGASAVFYSDSSILASAGTSPTCTNRIELNGYSYSQHLNHPGMLTLQADVAFRVVGATKYADIMMSGWFNPAPNPTYSEAGGWGFVTGSSGAMNLGTYTIDVTGGLTWSLWANGNPEGYDGSAEISFDWTAPPPPPDPGLISVSARLRKSGTADVGALEVAVFPTFAAGTAPNNYAPGYAGEAVDILGDATDTNPSPSIHAMRSRVDGFSSGQRDYSPKRQTSSEVWTSPAAPGGGQQEIFVQAGYTGLSGLAWVQSNPTYANFYNLVPSDVPAGPTRLENWPTAPSGRPDFPWEIVADWHDARVIGGGFAKYPEGQGYGLEFEQTQFRAQKWEWRHPVTGVTNWAVPDPLRRPLPNVDPAETLDTAIYSGGTAASTNAGLGSVASQGPVFLRAVDRWAPTIRPDPPIGRLGGVRLDPMISNAEVEFNWGATVRKSDLGVVWSNQFSASEMPDGSAAMQALIDAGYRRSPTMIAPGGTTTFTAIRNGDGLTVSDAELLAGVQLNAGLYTVTAAYTPAGAEYYGPTSVTFTIRVNPQFTITVGEELGEPSASIERYVAGSWVPVPAGTSTFERNDTTIRLRATPGNHMSWGTDFDSNLGQVWTTTPDTGWLFQTANPDVSFTLPYNINQIGISAGAHRLAPRVLNVTVLPVPDRCDPTGPNSPWVYIARPGIQIAATARSRESGIRRFEAFFLPPGHDAGSEDPATGWVPATVVDPGAAGISTSPVLQNLVFKIGRTRFDDGETVPGAEVLPNAESMAWGGWKWSMTPPQIQIRVRAQELAASSRWSDWYYFNVYGIHAANRRMLTMQSTAPVVPVGASEWVSPTVPISEPLVIWIW